MNDQEFRSRLDADLSQICWSARDAQSVRDRVKQGGRKMKKRIATALVLAAVMVLGTLTACAAGLIFSPRADAGRTADAALEAQYGITQEMQVYFHREIAEQSDGAVLVTYTGNWDLKPFLGVYTVTVKGKTAQAAWSHDGESTEGGLNADAWGAGQLAQILESYQNTGDNVEIFALAESKGARPEAPEPEAAKSQEEFDEEQKALAAKCALSVREMVDLARQAAKEVYGLTDSQQSALSQNPYLSWYFEKEDGSVWYEICLTLSQRPDAYTLGDGDYVVTVNGNTGLIDDARYEAPLAGNG